MENKNISPENLSAIISQFMPFIEKKVSSYKLNGFSKEDLIQEGRIALMSAVNTYKEEKGVSQHVCDNFCNNSNKCSGHLVCGWRRVCKDNRSGWCNHSGV